MKHQKLDTMDLVENLTSIIFESKNRLSSQVQSDIESVLFNNSKKTMWDCEVEYNNINDQYKKSLDIPTAQAMIDMGCSDPGYLELRYWNIKEDRSLCCKNPVTGERVKNAEAGRLDQCCFTELCVPIKNRLYRLEMKTGREIAKHKDIVWIKNQINCTLQEAEEFKTAFEILNLDKNTVFKIIFGEHRKDPGIQSTGNEFLSKYKDLAEEMKKFELKLTKMSIYEEDQNGNDIDDMWQNSLDPEVMEANFKEDLPVDSNIFTLKRLSIPEESLSEEEISEIKDCDYNKYKKILNRYMDQKWVFVGKDTFGKNKFRPVGKKITQEKISSAISMAWIYLNEAKERFNNEKDLLVKQALEEGVSDPVYDAIENFKKNKDSRSAKYRLTTCIYGGEWNGEKIPKATPGEAEICWRVINNKL
jgi:hypothetical protein